MSAVERRGDVALLKGLRSMACSDNFIRRPVCSRSWTGKVLVVFVSLCRLILRRRRTGAFGKAIGVDRSTSEIAVTSKPSAIGSVSEL